MNFLKIVLQKFDDQLLGLLGAVLGENEGKVRDGVNSTVPKVLDAMVAVSKVKEGRGMLWRELRDIDASVANNFSQQLYYKDSQSMIQIGRDQLDSLVGAEASRLVQSVSREADLGGTTAKRLVSAVTPLVFASMAEQQQSKNLNETELADVIAAQAGHLDNWKRQSSDYFPTGSNSDEDNSPLFKSLPTDNHSQNFIAPNDDSSSNAGRSEEAHTSQGTQSAAKASASAALGAHRFGNADSDQASDQTNGSSKTFDQRSEERRQRESIAINPARASNSTNSYSNVSNSTNSYSSDSDSYSSDSDSYSSDSDSYSSDSDSTDSGSTNADPAKPYDSDTADSSKSSVTGAIAATGVGAAGVAAAAMGTFSKDASTNSSVKDSESENSKLDVDAKTNTYDSNQAVSGFAATTATPDKLDTTESGNKRLWTPEAADRDQNGTLRYSSDGNPIGGTSTTAASTGGKKSGGWFHWLWWPVLIFGSLLAAGIFLLDQDGLKQQATDPSGASIAANQEEGEGESQNDGESDAGDPTYTATAAISTSNEEDTSEDGTGKDSPEIEIAASDDSDDATNSNESPDSSAPNLAAADSNDDAAMNSNSDSDSPTRTQTPATEQSTGDKANQNGETKAETDSNAADSTQEDSPSPAESAENQTTNDTGSNANASVSVDPELDADEQVEELLETIETKLNGVDSKAKANAAKQTLSQQVSELEKVLSNRQQWKDEIEILVDFQLDEGKKMLSKKKKKMFKTEAVKNTLGDLFKKLEKLMTSTVDQP